MPSRTTTIALRSTVAVGLAATAVGVGYTQYDKAVTLSVDGKASEVHVLGSTVADALEDEGIRLGQHDAVVPVPTAALKDGQAISVRYGRPLTVTVDGAARTHWTTATTVDAALGQLGIRADGATLSASRSAPLGRSGLALTVTTPKDVSVTADGKKRTLTSTAPHVRALLAEARVAVKPRDRVNPSLATALRDGLDVTVKRVVVKRVTDKQRVGYSTTTKKSAALYTDQRRVQKPGKAGVRTVVTEKTLVDGKLEKSKRLSSTVTKAPVAAVVVAGTTSRPVAAASKARSSRASASRSPGSSSARRSGGATNGANGGMWDRIASCESGGNWSINTGNGYYGGLQFDIPSWRANGGTDFAARPDQASKAQQITVANRYYAKAGLGPWGCAHAAR